MKISPSQALIAIKAGIRAGALGDIAQSALRDESGVLVPLPDGSFQIVCPAPAPKDNKPADKRFRAFVARIVKG